MSDLPEEFSLDATVRAGTMKDAVTAVLQAARATQGLPPPRGWRLGSEGTVQESAEGVPNDAPSIDIVFEDDANWGVLRPFEGARGVFAFGLDHGTGGEDAARITAALRGIVALCRALVAAGALEWALLDRLRGGRCLPDVALVRQSSHVLLTSRTEIDAAYGDHAAFASAWDSVEELGSLLLCTRALDAVANPDFLRHVLCGHLALARAARRGQARLPTPRYEVGERELLAAGEPTLRESSYHRPTEVYELEATPGEDVRMIDLHHVSTIMRTRMLEGTRPVREVRAVFADERQAHRAAPLMAMVGALTVWKDEAGKAHVLPR